MRIEHFVAQSEGHWRSMRNGHSLAFKHFEQIISKVIVSSLEKDDGIVLDLLDSNKHLGINYVAPFKVKWEVEDDWDVDNNSENKSGSSILIPFPKTLRSGYILRSQGYTEPIKSLSSYNFLEDGTFKLITKYEKTVTEERIWFLSKNMRCRSSVIFTENKNGIIQTSYASEVKLPANENKNS